MGRKTLTQSINPVRRYSLRHYSAHKNHCGFCERKTTAIMEAYPVVHKAVWLSSFFGNWRSHISHR